jgi:hypothetical protein
MSKTAKLKPYRRRSLNRNQRWGWRLTAMNGRKIATSGEGYANRQECIDMGLAVTGGDYSVIVVVD